MNGKTSARGRTIERKPRLTAAQPVSRFAGGWDFTGGGTTAVG